MLWYFQQIRVLASDFELAKALHLLGSEEVGEEISEVLKSITKQ